MKAAKHSTYRPVVLGVLITFALYISVIVVYVEFFAPSSAEPVERLFLAGVRHIGASPHDFSGPDVSRDDVGTLHSSCWRRNAQPTERICVRYLEPDLEYIVYRTGASGDERLRIKE